MDLDRHPHSQLDRRYLCRFLFVVWLLWANKVILEFYPYFRFLGAHWAEDHEEFSKQFGNLKKV